jgi:hypothetical protein
MTPTEWTQRYPEAALALRHLVLPECAPPSDPRANNEAAAQVAVRLEGSKAGIPLWRNNIGAGTVVESGTFVRWGLANDSSVVNARIKSGDLIGCRPVVITPLHVGCTIGQFVSREIKKPGWRYTGTAREIAQMRWAELILSLGGDAAIVTGTGSL